MCSTALIRLICGELAREEDPGKIHDLVGLLNAVIQDEAEEVRFYMELIRQRYGLAFESKAADA